MTAFLDTGSCAVFLRLGRSAPVVLGTDQAVAADVRFLDAIKSFRDLDVHVEPRENDIAILRAHGYWASQRNSLPVFRLLAQLRERAFGKRIFGDLGHLVPAWL